MEKLDEMHPGSYLWNGNYNYICHIIMEHDCFSIHTQIQNPAYNILDSGMVFLVAYINAI
jgi:hypothetical protein